MAALFVGEAIEVGQMILFVGGEDGRVDIVLATDGGGIAERLRHLFDRCHFLLLDGRLVVGRATFVQQARGQDGAAPGAKVLGRKVKAGSLTQIGIDIGRGERGQVRHAHRNIGRGAAPANLDKP